VTDSAEGNGYIVGLTVNCIHNSNCKPWYDLSKRVYGPNFITWTSTAQIGDNSLTFVSGSFAEVSVNSFFVTDHPQLNVFYHE